MQRSEADIQCNRDLPVVLQRPLLDVFWLWWGLGGGGCGHPGLVLVLYAPGGKGMDALAVSFFVLPDHRGASPCKPV